MSPKEEEVEICLEETDQRHFVIGLKSGSEHEDLGAAVYLEPLGCRLCTPSLRWLAIKHPV